MSWTFSKVACVQSCSGLASEDVKHTKLFDHYDHYNDFRMSIGGLMSPYHMVVYAVVQQFMQYPYRFCIFVFNFLTSHRSKIQLFPIFSRLANHKNLKWQLPSIE